MRLSYLLGLLIALLALILRVQGINWDEGKLLHPDERFLWMVSGAVEWPKSLSGYFATDSSSLNPHNRDFNFFVYGTLPLFIFKAAGTLLEPFGVPRLIAMRGVSALFDLGSVALVFLSAAMLFGRRAAYIAAAFSALSVLQIQHAHFGVVDAQLTFWVTAGLTVAVLVSRSSSMQESGLWSVLYGVCIGCALASKVNAALAAPLVLLAAWMRHSAVRSIMLSVVAAVVTLCVFRLANPYAFLGPSFFDLSINPRWLLNLQDLRRLAQPDTSFPPSVQWIGRGHLFGLQNMMVWGLGLPVGVAAFFALGFASLRLKRGDRSFLLPVTLIAAWLVAFGLIPEVVTLRYLLPIYPAVYVVLGGVIEFWLSRTEFPLFRTVAGNFARTIAAMLLLSAFVWAIGFTSIYRRHHTRVAASRWIISEIPAAVSLEGRSASGKERLPVLLSQDLVLRPGKEATLSVSVPEQFALDSVILPYLKPAEPPVSVLVQPFNPLDCVAASSAKGGQVCQLVPKTVHRISLSLPAGGPAERTLRLPRVAHETSWDDPLPLRMEFDPWGKLFPPGLNFELYHQDDRRKLDRIVNILGEAEYIFISSNRVWGSAGRLPREFPLVQRFYRELVSCPETRTVVDCYAGLRAGEKGRLGFSVAAVFESYPSVLGIPINTQFAEEAFSVYDHPKVILLRKDMALSREDLFKAFERVRS